MIRIEFILVLQAEIFKDRYTGHKHTFNHEKKNSTRLSDYVWQCFNSYGNKLEIKWSIIHHVNGDIGGVWKICQICNLERLSIAAEDKKTSAQ